MDFNRMDERFLRYSRISFTALLSVMIGIVYLSPSVYSSDAPSKDAYYVSVNGNDDNPGTFEEPWRTIQKAADTLIAGEAVFVRGGVYEEFVRIHRSGSAKDGYITFQAYPGEQPILEGKNLTPTSRNQSQFFIHKASYVVIEGFEIRGLTSDSPHDYLAGLKVSGGGSHIVITNNDIHSISNLATKGNAHGLLVYGDSLTPISSITITGNEIHHLTSGSSESLTLDGNVKDFVISFNHVHHNNNIGIDIIGHYQTCSAPCVDQARNGIVANNLVHHIDTSQNPAYGNTGVRAAAGIYIDGGTNVIVENNEVYNSNFGIELASEIPGKDTSHVTVRNNYLHHNDGAGMIMGGSSSTNGGARQNHVVNNTLYMNDTMQQGYAEITLQNYNVDNAFLNNIIYTFPNKRFIKMSGTNGKGNLIDYNVYYRTDGVDGKSWRYNGIRYQTWTAFKNATGFDQHSLFADPLFMEIDRYGPYLSAQSPAVNRGSLDVIGSMRNDFYNKPRVEGGRIDVGAAEYRDGHIPNKPVYAPSNPPTGQGEPWPDELQPEQGKPSKGEIGAKLVDVTIDGIGNDWSSFPALHTSESNVRSLKAFRTLDTLYVLVEGHRLTEKGQLFIDIGNGVKAFEAPYWSSNQSSFLIENGTLYQYNGTGGTNWNWSKVTTYRKTNRYAFSATAVEYAIPLADLIGVHQTVLIGYVWNDSPSDKLPMTSKMVTIDVNKTTTE
ncbi:right-handed parallel beta-helix repeat-containing protein [Sporosarcina saromensis]|uniref:Right-handed parallel beta-helix repeat-containing protein n=1 Tax=Sporosarcina saromensis TaxID=359365 RepID=A0ABU4G7Y6_9BACL|nr:right-handed parallel beta-helix repeat-containing protein [Sporosarcina saromensis]MDW0113076.1 right-handed parallel beta-helix repeat-containing protein [Sporosarcina saromensis]